MGNIMGNKLESQQSASHGECCYIENLPDELVILIFTKLSSTSSEGNLDDIKSLGQCSIVSKRFNSLACLVPTLCIIHPSLETLYECCPKILKKFKYIRSLQVLHCSSTDLGIDSEHTSRWEAVYRPQSYCLALVFYKKVSYYPDEQVRQSLMLSDDVGLFLDKSLMTYLICHHHMLVSSIKDHKYLQRVVVSDYSNSGTLTLEEDMLVKLRNCSSTKLEQSQTRYWFGGPVNLDIPFRKTPSGVVINNTCFKIIEFKWHEDDDVDREIPVDVIRTNETIRDGDTIVSSRGEFELGFFSPGVAAADEGSRYSSDSCEERSDAIIRRKVFDVLSELGFDLGAPPAAREIGLGDLGTPAAAHAIGFAAPTASDGGAAWGLPAADYGDVNSIRVGSGTNIQDNYSLVHVAKTNLAGKVLPTIIDDNVTIGKNGKALRKKFALGVVHETPAYLP